MEHELSDLNTLYDAYKASMKGSAWKKEPQRFERDFLSEINALSHELDDRTYKTLHGSEFVISERGKTRYIHGGRMRDRVARHALCDTELNKALKPYLIHNNGASQKGKGISFSRAMFEEDLHNYYLEHGTNEGCITFVDFSKYYDNILHEEVRKEVTPKVSGMAGWLMSEILHDFEVDVSYMTEEEYTHCLEEKFDSIAYHNEHTKEELTGEKFMQKSMEIGDQSSQSIGIFYPTPVDNYVKTVRGIKYYGRYMDDLYFITKTKEEATDIIEGIKEVAGRIGLFVNEKKTRTVKLSSTFRYLQIRYSLSGTGKVIKRIGQITVTRERRKLKAYRRKLDKGEIPYEDIENAYKSWMGNYARLMSKLQIRHMKSLYKELFGKDPRWKKERSISKTGRKSKPHSTATTTSQSKTSLKSNSGTATSETSTEIPWTE